MIDSKEKANLIWTVADFLRDDYKQGDYSKAILSLTYIKRLDYILEPKKKKFLVFPHEIAYGCEILIDTILNRVAGFNFYNCKQYKFSKPTVDSNFYQLNIKSS